MIKKVRHRVQWTPEDDALLRQRLEAGAYLHEVADLLGRSQEAVRTRANLLGVATRTAPREMLRGARLNLQLG